MAVRNRFQVLLWAKQAQEERQIDLTEIERITGVSRQTLHKYLKNKMVFVNLEVIEALCTYFDCEVGEFLYIEKAEAS